MLWRRLKKHFEMAADRGISQQGASKLVPFPWHGVSHSLTTRRCKQWCVLVSKFYRINSEFTDNGITRDFSMISTGFG